MWRHGQRHEQKACYKYWNYRSQSVIYKLTCVAYKNKIQNRLIALVIKCIKSHIGCIWNESVNGTGCVWTDFIIKIPRAIGLGMTKCSISRNRLKRNRVVVCKRIRCQWSISMIICICTIAYEAYIIYSSVCVVCRRYYVVPSPISHI